MKRRNSIGVILLGALIFVVGWHLASILVNRTILPSPLAVFPVFTDLILDGTLLEHFGASFLRVMASIIVATALALPSGLLLGRYTGADRVLTPVIALLYSIPKIVLLPVVYVLLGISDVTKVALIVLIIFFPMLVVVRDKASAIERPLIDSVRSLGSGTWGLLRHVYLPASLPALLTSLRLSVGTAVAILFFVEQSLTQQGLGYYIVVQTYQALRYTEMYAGIVAMSLLGFFLYYSLDVLDYTLNRYSFIE